MYQEFQEVTGFTRVVPLEEIRARDSNLSIPLYVASAATAGQGGSVSSTNGLPDALSAWLASAAAIRQSLAELLDTDAKILH